MQIDKKTIIRAIKEGAEKDLKKRSYRAKINYNKVAFICQALLPILDELVDTNQARFGLKKAIKDFIRESESVIKDHYDAYASFGLLSQPEEGDIDAKEVYKITALAYDWVLDLLQNYKHNEVLAVKGLVDQYLESGKKLEDVNINFKPMQ